MTHDTRAMRLAAMASVAMALSLIFGKVIAWWLSGSVAMLGSLLDSALDLSASIVTFIAVRTATVPADDDHRFGHGKAEALAGLFQAAVLGGSAFFLILQAVERFAEPRAVTAPELGIGVSIAAIVLTFALVAFQRAVVKKTGSLAIEADSLHYAGDIYLNASVVAAYIANAYAGILWLDPLLALVIAGILGWNARQIAKRSIDMLMDKEWPEEEREKIIGLVLQNPDIQGVHELRTRSAGVDDFIQFHIDLDPKMTVAQAHAIADEVEATVGEAYPRAEILIHIDPLGLVEHGEEKAIP